MICADYIYYVDEFHGRRIPDQTAFDALSTEASAYLDAYLIGRRVSVSDPIRNAYCAVCDVLYEQQQAKREKVVASESVGNHSVSFHVAQKTDHDWDLEKAKVIRLYLRPTGLLFGGLR